MNETWDARYEENPFCYGIEPNQFFKEFIDASEAGKLLLPGDGEGRNAVYAALNEFEVDSFDYSAQAVEHAKKFAVEKDVTVNFYQADLFNYEGKTNYYDTVAAIYIHLPSEGREIAHKHFVEALKPGGHLVMEMFAKEQLDYKTGGPGNVDWLYDLEEFERDFADLEILFLEQMEVELNEGTFHKGLANVIRFIGRKKN